MWRTVFGRVASLWHGLPVGVRGFTSGILGGLIVLTAFSGSCGSNRKDRIALENLHAALDSTRAITAKHDTVYARLIAQKDVELTGALRTVAHRQHDKPRAVVTVAVGGRGLDTTTSHTRTDVGGVEGSTGQHFSASDSLSLTAPPVVGTVKATVTDSTWLWSAHLRPSPVDLTLALTCGPNGPEVLAQGPSWVSTSIGTGQAASEVCHPKPSRWFAGVKTGVVVTSAVVVALKILHVF